MATTPSRNSTLKYWESNRERVVGLNRRAAAAINKKLSKTPLIEEQICISAVGSDGRLEKGLDSKLELQILHKELNPHAVKEIDRMLREIESGGQPLLNDSESEIKLIGTDPVAYAFGNRCIPSPARLLDSFILFGNPDLQKEAREVLVQELSGKEGKKLLKKLKEMKRVFKGVMERGSQNWKGMPITHYDLEGGISYFKDCEDGNGDCVQVRGFKIGPLRYVQGAIEQNLAAFVRSMLAKGDSNGAVMVLNELPTPTVEKLDYLRDIGAATISPQAISEAADCYLRFLQLYHMAEWMAAKGKREMRFDSSEAKSRIGTLSRVLEGGIVESI